MPKPLVSGAFGVVEPPFEDPLAALLRRRSRWEWRSLVIGLRDDGCGLDVDVVFWPAKANWSCIKAAASSA